MGPLSSVATTHHHPPPSVERCVCVRVRASYSPRDRGGRVACTTRPSTTSIPIPTRGDGGVVGCAF